MIIWEMLRDIRKSKKTLVCVIMVSLASDTFLLTVIVPIIPVVLLEKCHEDYSTAGNVHNMTPYGENNPGDGEKALGDARSFCEEAVNTNLGLLLASQFVVKMVMTPFGGYLSEKFGYSLLMLIACLLMLTSTIVYAIADSYILYLIGRLIHGLAAVPSIVGGFGLIGHRFQDDDEQRGFAAGLMICGLAIGTMVGPIYGGVASYKLGPTTPFIILAGFITLLVVAQIVMFQNDVSKKREDPMAILDLLKDPLTLITAGALTMASMIYGILEPSLPVWMIKTMGSEKWQLGIVFLPSGLCYVLSSVLLGYISYKIGRWQCIAACVCVISICITTVPFATSVPKLIAPMAVLGFCFGTVDTTCAAVMFYLVGSRHNGAYGASSALSAFAFSVGFIVGPSISSALLNRIGFAWVLRGLGIFTIVFTPLCFCLRGSDMAPPYDKQKEEQLVILPVEKPETVVCRLTN